ncbi:MAG: TIGR02281 family clan AA aspartic protease [Rhizobiales bacterium]|nr:TIGR02281 family clan AA aspartic protease [Hyphomicrobiales bacterium]
MDQISKWVSGIAIASIALYYAVVHGLLPSIDDPAARRSAEKPPVETVALAAPRIEKPARADDDDASIPGRAVRLKAGVNGHFYLDASVNGAHIPFLVDTGASMVALSYESAERAGVRLRKSDFIHSANTANGVVEMAVVTLDTVRYKNILVRDVRAAVLPKGALGGANLLGNSFLARLQEYKVRDNTLIMIP